MCAAQPFGRLLVGHCSHKRLGGGTIHAVGDFRKTCYRRETTLVIEVIAAQRTNVIQGAPLEAGNVISGHQLHVIGILRCLFHDRLVQPRWHAVDKIDVTGKLAVFFFGYTAGNKDTQMADTFVHGINNRLARGANVVNAVIKIEDPTQRLLGRGDIVAFGAKANDRRYNCFPGSCRDCPKKPSQRTDLTRNNFEAPSC